MNSIVNAAPMSYMQGIKDNSTRQLVTEPEVIPTHLPIVYVFAADGPTDPQLVIGNGMMSIYGDETFDMRKPFATHQTVLARSLSQAGNSMMIQRVIPSDAAPAANMRLSLDVLETPVPEYKRMADGSLELDAFNRPKPTGKMLDGYKARWVVSYIEPDQDGVSQFGLGNQQPGEQFDEVSGTQSVLYPVLDFEVPFQGKNGCNKGVRIWAPTLRSSSPMNDQVLREQKVFPFRVQCVRRPDVNGTPRVVQNNFGEESMTMVFRPKTIDKNTDTQLSFDTQFIPSYQNLNDPSGRPNKYGPFGRVHQYTTNISTLLSMFYEMEKSYIDQFSDFNGTDEDEFWAFNAIGGVSSYGVPYHTFILNSDGPTAVRLTENSTIYARGGTDGTMDLVEFDKLVSEAVSSFADETSPLLDMARYPLGFVWDTGFGLKTKYELLKIMAIRKDTMAIVTTHIVGGKKLTASEESSLAVNLRTRAQMYPESDVFGTGTCRAVIVGRSGVMPNAQYDERLPLSIQLAIMAAKYWGAGDGKWKSGFSFDAAPNNQITEFIDVNVAYTPASVRNKDWTNGMIWPEHYSMRALYFPHTKTVYNNDTSVLTSFITVAACAELQRIGEAARREYSGNSKLTNAQLKDRIEKFVSSRVVGKFDDRFVIEPEVVFTAADLARGYSWTLRIKIFAPNMKTVQTLSIEAYRIEDLVGA